MANTKGADQPAQMRRLVCPFVIGVQPSQMFSLAEAHLKMVLFVFLFLAMHSLYSVTMVC